MLIRWNDFLNPFLLFHTLQVNWYDKTNTHQFFAINLNHWPILAPYYLIGTSRLLIPSEIPASPTDWLESPSYYSCENSEYFCEEYWFGAPHPTEALSPMLPVPKFMSLSLTLESIISSLPPFSQYYQTPNKYYSFLVLQYNVDGKTTINLDKTLLPYVEIEFLGKLSNAQGEPIRMANSSSKYLIIFKNISKFLPANN